MEQHSSISVKYSYSFIVPVYNVELYLRECVNSLLSQSYGMFEIILVDDGSTDKSGDICDELSSEDSRIKVIHKENGGLSEARNTGLRAATGDWVIFVDGDDFWHSKEDLEVLDSVIRETPDCDFIGFNCSYYFPSADKFSPWVAYNPELENPIEGKRCFQKLVAAGTFPMSACLKVIKRKFLIENELTFIPGIYSEDIPWFVELLEKSKRCRFINQYIYCYRKEVEGSISSKFGMKKFTDLFNTFEQGVNKSAENTALLSFWAYELCILLGMTVFMKPPERNRWRRTLWNYKFLFAYRLNPKVRKVAQTKTLCGRRIIIFLLGIYIRKTMHL